MQKLLFLFQDYEVVNDEMSVVRLAVKGDREAFESLVSSHSQMVYNLALRLCHNSEEAMDISQEAFLRAFRAISYFRGDSSFTTWLYRITINCARRAMSPNNANEKKKTVPLFSDDEGLSPGDCCADKEMNPEETIEYKETIRLALSALSRLSPKYRVILILREMEDLSYGEIAKILRTSEGTVKSRISRAREALRVEMKEKIT